MDLHLPVKLPLFPNQASLFLLKNSQKRLQATHEEEEFMGIDSVRKKLHLVNEGEGGGSEPPTEQLGLSLSDENAAGKMPSPDNPPTTGDILATTSLREKYAQLLPQPPLQEFSLEHRTLIRIQKHLDEHLFYLKTHRGKKKGEFFKSLRKNLIQGGSIIMDLLHLKQILFIDSTLYICSRERVRDHSYDVLLDLPSTDILGRRVEFREKMVQYVKSQRQEKGRRVIIPSYKFPFELEIEHGNQLLSQRREEEQISSQREQARLESERITNPKNLFNRDFQFKAALNRLIQSKEAKHRERESRSSSKYGREEVLKVVDEIFVLYNVKKVSNMFHHTLTESLSRKLLILDNVVEQIVGRLLDGEFLKKIDNNKGVILQMNNKKYKECREKVLSMKFQ